MFVFGVGVRVSFFCCSCFFVVCLLVSLCFVVRHYGSVMFVLFLFSGSLLVCFVMRFCCFGCARFRFILFFSLRNYRGVRPRWCVRVELFVCLVC